MRPTVPVGVGIPVNLARSVAVDLPFALGWIVAIGGGVALVLSAFAPGAPLVVIGIVLAVGGFVTIGWAHRSTLTARADPVARPRPPTAASSVSLWDPMPEGPSPLLDAEPGPAPAAVAPSPAAGATNFVPLVAAPTPDPAPAALGAAGEGTGAGSSPLATPGPTAPPESAPVLSTPAQVVERTEVEPSRPPEPSDAAGSGPDPTAPEAVATAGEVLPTGAARSLALLGLPWDPGPAAESAAAHVAAPATSPPPAPPAPPAEEAWREIPSIVFAGEAQRWQEAEWYEGPAETPTAPSSPAESMVSRSGAFVVPRPPSEGFSSSWLVPGLSVLDSGLPVRDATGLVTRVPELPSRVGRRIPRCVACGDPSGGGATGENRCWGCGRPVCTDCFWRYGPGPAVHRCPSCAALGPPMSVSGGRRTVRASGPFGTVDEPDWNEGL